MRELISRNRTGDSSNVWNSINRTAIYWSLNAVFVFALVFGSISGPGSNVHPVYLALLFALCTIPVFKLRGFNDRYALLAIFCVVYFQYYGVLDVITLFRGSGTDVRPSGLISETEIAILVGGALALAGYLLSSRESSGFTRITKDWPERTLVIVGGALWCVAAIFTWEWQVKVLAQQTSEGAVPGLAGLSNLQVIGLLLATMMQPLGILILAYAHCRYRRGYLLPIVIGVALFQLVLGFVIDVKGEALIGAVLVIVTYLLVEGKVPKGWLIASIVFIAIAFPALQANRMIRNQNNLDHVDVAQNLVKVAKEAFAKSDQVTKGELRSQTVFERSSLKGSVEMIVTRTGHDVPYQNGYTLTPMYAAFIPKIIWPNKPDVQTGRLVNSEFGVATDFAATYISPSHLGELYWNFGWPGVVFGMPLIGLLLGYIGKRVDMSGSGSVTKLMVAAITIRQLILGFESSIAVVYVVWVRSLAAIALMHLFLATKSSVAGDSRSERSQSEAKADELAPAFPNLMR